MAFIYSHVYDKKWKFYNIDFISSIDCYFSCRFYYMSFAVNRFLKIENCDILYNPLPLYHTAGGIIGVGQAFLRGTTVVIKKKFSASRFWDDCVHHKCTVSIVL